MTAAQAVLLGDAAVDMLIRLPDRAAGQLDLTDSTPQLHGGGSAANVAVALARLGVTTTMVGAVGDDGYGRWVRDDLAREGVDTRGLRLLHDPFTPMVMALIEPTGERLIVVWPPQGGSQFQLEPAHIDPTLMAGASWLHTTGICLRASPAREAVLHGLELAREAGLTVSLDLNLRLELWKLGGETRRTFERAIELSDVIFGNGREEIAPMAGMDSVEDAARSLCGGRRIVVARQGAEGTLAATPEETFHVPAFRTQVVDTLGAGDAFDGGFIAARLAKRDVRESVRWGNAVAALKIGRAGARGLPSREELLQILG